MTTTLQKTYPGAHTGAGQKCAKSIETTVLQRMDGYDDTSLVIEDDAVSPVVSQNLFVAVEGDDMVELGKKRCTKWKKGRRFCVQREGFLKWRFGWQYQ